MPSAWPQKFARASLSLAAWPAAAAAAPGPSPQIIWQTPMPAWAIAAAAAALAAGWILSVVGLPAGRQRRSLGLLRGAALGLLLLIVLEPACERRHGSREAGWLAVVLDDSASMALAGPEGASRWQRAVAALRSPAWRQRTDGLQTRWFGLRAPLPGLPNTAPPPHGAQTDLMAALRAVQEGPGVAPSAILVVSDGADQGSLAAADADGQAALGASLRRLGVPVHTLAVGDLSPLIDVAVADITAEPIAFVRNTTQLTVTLRAQGLAGRQVPVTLRQDGALVATQRLTLSDGEAGSLLHFALKPERTGMRTYEVEVEPQPEESHTDNNRAAVVQQVVRDRTRVLHVAGHPSWDARFLREFFAAQANLDLVSFFILRLPTSDAQAGTEALSLIPFPVGQLFTEELPNFDVVVLQDFDPRPFGMLDHLPSLAAAVRRQGVGLAVTGGPHAMGAAAYADTPLAEVLPCLMTAEDYRPVSVHPVATPLAAAHPVSAGWQASLPLPPWHGLNLSRPHPDAQVLMAADSPDGAPLLACRQVENGRSLVVMSPGAWGWRFGDQAATQSAAPRAYSQMWAQALRYLAQDPSVAALRLGAADRRLPVGGQQLLTVSARDQALAPEAGVPLEVTIYAPNEGGRQTLRQSTAADGCSRLSVAAPTAGSWRATVRRLDVAPQDAASPGEPPEREAEAHWVVSSCRAEEAQLAPRPDLLRRLAAASGGQAWQLGPPSSPLPSDLKLTADTRFVTTSIELRPIWDNAWTLTAILALWLTDWLLRRRWGLR